MTRAALALLAAAFLAVACVRSERDPLAAYHVDPEAFGIPPVTLFSIPF